MTTREQARQYVAAGLSVIPIHPDGRKRPALDGWKEMQDRLPSPSEVEDWFPDEVGLAVVCGAVSRNLEVLDFDGAGVWERWKARVLAKDPHSLDGIPRVRTPGGGRHLYLFREHAGPCRKLAKREADGKTLIEVKGEGGYVLAPGCPPACHPTRGEYVWEVDLATTAYRVGA
jgi:hypothetical protein